MPLYHPERRGATFKKVFPAPFPNNITTIMLLTRRTVKFKQHYYTREKFKASLILFVFALIMLVVGVLSVVFGEDIGLGMVANILFSVSIMLYLVLMNVSLLLNWLYRKNCLAAGASSTTLYVFQFIFLAPEVILFAVLLVYALMHGYIGGDEQIKKIKVIGADGKEYILTQLYAGSYEYKDQYGDLWVTHDYGNTFERVTKKVETEDGKEHNLTPTWEAGIVNKKQFYDDENGNEWVSQDGGQTVETVIKKIIGEDGKQYILKPRFAGNTEYYTDQYGDDWRTWDGGKTYKKE